MKYLLSGIGIAVLCLAAGPVHGWLSAAARALGTPFRWVMDRYALLVLWRIESRQRYLVDAVSRLSCVLSERNDPNLNQHHVKHDTAIVIQQLRHNLEALDHAIRARAPDHGP